MVIDELHALAGNKRGDLLALGLARLRALAPGRRIVGLSATVAWPDELAPGSAGWRPSPASRPSSAAVPAPLPEVDMLEPGE